MNLVTLDRVLRERTGLDPAALGPNALDAAVTARMSATGVESRAQYESTSIANDAEWSHLLDTLLVPESWFFRGSRALFDALAQHLVRTATRQNRPARALCVPCGIGEEPYSLAIALHDLGATATTVTIEAWDLSETHLARAAAARYSVFSLRETEPCDRDRFFQPTDREGWLLSPKVTPFVRFAHCNLARPANESEAGSFDLVVCRNVFIYLTEAARKQALANLLRWLAPEGWLCLSPSEADRLPRGEFERLEIAGSLIYHRTRNATPARASASKTIRSEPRLLPVDSRAVEAAPPVRHASPPQDPLVAIREAANRGELDSALKNCRELLASGSPSASIYSLLGVIQLASGEGDHAFDSFTKALYLQPDHAESLEHLALLSEQRGDRNRAAALRRKWHRSTGGGTS